MSFVSAQPETLKATADNLQTIGSTVNAVNAAASRATTEVIPAAADHVSALTAAQFVTHAQLYQAISAQAEAIHQEFVAALGLGANSYALTESANAAAAG